MRKRASTLLLILCCLPLVGCITRLLGGGGEPMLAGDKESIPLSKLDRIILNFADRDVILISDACEAVKREGATPEERRRAQHFKLANGTAVYDIVTSPNSLAHLVDLYVMIHLQHLVLVDEGNAGRLFGEKGAARLIAALEQVRGEIDQVARFAMKSRKKAQLDAMIQDWRKRNPQVEFVSGIRFGNLPELSGKTILEVIPSFFDVINPMDDTSRSVEETRQLAERAFHFSKRLPKLLHWQTDSALEDILAKPELHQVLKDVTQTSGSIDRVSKILSSQDELRETLAEVRGVGQAFERTFDALNRLVEPAREAARAEASKPFDIADYTAAASEIATMAREANSLLTSPAWTERREDASRLANETLGRAELGSRRTVNHLALRMVQVLVVFFVLLALYRILMKQIGGRRNARNPAAQTFVTPRIRSPGTKELRPSAAERRP